jgi:hypothetical protein
VAALKFLQAAVVPGWLAVESPSLSDKGGPAPRHPPLILGRVRSFARHGMSAVCLAIYKARQVAVISLQGWWQV